MQSSNKLFVEQKIKRCSPEEEEKDHFCQAKGKKSEMTKFKKVNFLEFGYGPGLLNSELSFLDITLNIFP